MAKNIGCEKLTRRVTSMPRMTNRERGFLAWLLEPGLLGDRVPGPTKKDLGGLSASIERLKRLRPARQIAQEIHSLEVRRASWQEDIRFKKCTYVSPIMQWSSIGGSENIQAAKRWFVATLIARKHDPKPYKFLIARFTSPWFTEKAIEMRVRRFEERLQAQGPMSCKEIVEFLYDQFLTVRRSKRIARMVRRYDEGRITYKESRTV